MLIFSTIFFHTVSTVIIPVLIMLTLSYHRTDQLACAETPMAPIRFAPPIGVPRSGQARLIPIASTPSLSPLTRTKYIMIAELDIREELAVSTVNLNVALNETSSRSAPRPKRKVVPGPLASSPFVMEYNLPERAPADICHMYLKIMSLAGEIVKKYDPHGSEAHFYCHYVKFLGKASNLGIMLFSFCSNWIISALPSYIEFTVIEIQKELVVDGVVSFEMMNIFMRRFQQLDVDFAAK